MAKCQPSAVSDSDQPGGVASCLRRSASEAAYHRDRFNYAVDPFVIDSLDNFANEDLLFTGELLAGGIVPDVVEPLRLMDDYSLGFTTRVASGGTALYGGGAN